jgi:hypothetical protein
MILVYLLVYFKLPALSCLMEQPLGTSVAGRCGSSQQLLTPCS